MEPLLALLTLKLADLWSVCGEGLTKPSCPVRYWPGPGVCSFLSSNLALFTTEKPDFLLTGSLES